MNPQIEKLLDFHGAYSREQLRDLDAFRDLCTRYEDDEAFNTALDVIDLLHGGLETAMGQVAGYDGQVMAALKVARKYVRGRSRLEYLRELVRRRYATRWSAEQWDYFSDAAERVATWYAYFLSFTSYNPLKPGPSYVNLEHEMLILTGAGLRLESPDAVEKNLLARTLHSRLKSANLEGFYYDHLKDSSQPVEQRLKEAIAGSFTFIQVVQSDMFHRDPLPPINWCQLEYNAAATDPARILIIVTEPFEDLIQPANVPDPYVAWYQGVVGVDAVPLAPVWTTQEARSQLQELRKRVDQHIDQAHERLYAAIPL